jgi:hypothetical protein
MKFGVKNYGATRLMTVLDVENYYSQDLLMCKNVNNVFVSINSWIRIFIIARS